MDVEWMPLPLFSLQQFPHLRVPLNGCGGPPWGHALRALCDLPPFSIIFPDSALRWQPVALGFRRRGTQEHLARGPVLERLPALLRAHQLQAAASQPRVPS